MKRRELLAGAGAMVLGSAVGAGPASAADLAHEPYSRETYDQAIADGGPFMLDFFAPW